MKILLVLAGLLLLLPTDAYSQIRQAEGRTTGERTKAKAEQVERTEEEYRRLAAAEGRSFGPPAFTPARMNVDVQMVLAKSDVKGFAEAKATPAATIIDGDNLWLYVKFNGKLDRWVYRLRDAAGAERYLIFVEYGAQGETSAKSHSIIEFEKADLSATELKMSLSPGKAGRNNALAIFIRNIAASRPGRWSNELRLTNNPGFPRGPGDYLAKTAFVADFTKGFAKYPQMLGTFESMVLRDTTDETKLPIEGKFSDDALRSELQKKLAEDGIVPAKLYFAGDRWLEFSERPTEQRQFRTITAAFRYTRDEKCLYGTAVISQTYDPMADAYAGTKFEITKDLPTPCVAD